ncbi:MAG: DUF3467 domain-containing protein [Bacteroidota bacterium]
MNQNDEQTQQINIELTEDIAEGIYSNLAIIGHFNHEFVLDFIKVVPGLPKAKVKSRIILTPQHAKRLLKALHDNIHKYEEMNGEIVDNDMFKGIPMNFGGPTGMA